jgi:hypothetical protein
VVATCDHQLAQDEDGGGTVDQCGHSRGVFAGEQRPDGPNCSIDQHEPVSGGGDAVETLGSQHAQGLWNRQQAGERGAKPRQQLHHGRPISPSIFALGY